MEYIFREANKNDKKFLLNANEEINMLSGLNDSNFEKNIDKDLFEDRICKSLVIEENGTPIGFLLYSYVYWANCGRGIYLSNAYVVKEYRKKGVFKILLSELEKREKDSNFITNLVGSENTVMINSLHKLDFIRSELIAF